MNQPEVVASDGEQILLAAALDRPRTQRAGFLVSDWCGKFGRRPTRKTRFPSAALLGSVALLLLSTPVSAQFVPGSRSAGDPYLPTMGNGGYDVQHYDLTIHYDPAANTMESQARITMRAVQGLSEFSLDLRGFPGATVTIDGLEAGVAQDRDKLIVTPTSGIANERIFETIVNYAGRPSTIVDPDGSREGWVRIPTGGFVVNQPMGAMGWFPNNNDPADKATYEFRITVPDSHTALGNGELVGRVENGDGTTTWHWRMDFPMSAYLSTATVARFDYTNTVSARVPGASGAPLQIYNAFESGLPAAQKVAASVAASRQEAMIEFMSGEIGAPYPFDSHGIVLYRNAIGYALEVQTKPHFSETPIDLAILAHEIAHQWFGNCVGPTTWREIWFNEGWATWWEWHWDNQQNGNARTVEQQFAAHYNSAAQPARWTMAPADLPDASEMFSAFPVYIRPAMMLEAYRQIVGQAAFFALQRALVTEYAYGSISGVQFVALAKRSAQEHSGFAPSYLAQLDEFFRQWLFGKSKPDLTPSTFFRELPPRLLLRTISSAELEIVWPQTNARFTVEQLEDLNGAWTSLAVTPVLTNGEAKVVVTRPPGNRFYRLRSE